MASKETFSPLLSKAFFPLHEPTIDSYRYTADRNSALLPILQKYLVYPLVKITPRSITGMHLAMLAFIVSAVAFYISQAFRGRYPETTFPLIALCTFLYMIIDSMIQPLSRRQSDWSHLTDFLQHYFQGFAVGFFALIAGSLFTSDFLSYGPYLLVASYGAAFTTLQEYSSENRRVTIERYGPLEALMLIIVLCFVCIPRKVFWSLLSPIEYDLAPLDLFMLVVVAGALATALEAIRRSKLYLSPATVMYFASSLIFISIILEMRNTMLAMICFVLYNSELLGRMVLGRMIHPKEVFPHIIPLGLVWLGMEVEPYIWSYEITGYLFAIFFIGKHFLLACHAYLTVGDRHQAI